MSYRNTGNALRAAARAVWAPGLGALALLIVISGARTALAAGLTSPPSPLSGAERGSLPPLSAPERGLGGEVSSYQQADRDAATFLPEVTAGFAGIGRPGRWVTVRAVVTNDGPPIDGQLVLSVRAGGDAASYTQRVELPTRARKLLTFQVPGLSSMGELRLALRAGDDEIASRVVPLRLLNTTDTLIGVLSDDGIVPSGLGGLRRGGSPVAVAALTPADLPHDPLSFQALDVLVIRQASSDRLTSDQRTALRAWVEQGGQLIVAGGPGWRRSIDGLGDLLPIAEVGTRQVTHLRALDHYAGQPPPEGDVLVALGSPIAGARVLLSQDGVPLIAERWLGLGRVTFVGPDPGLEPFRSWPAAESLWQRIVVGGRPGLPALDATNAIGSPLRAALGEMLDLGLPAAGWVIGFLVVYVLLVGPGQYIVLRRLDRREWAWVTFPLLAAVAAGGLLAIATALRGPDVRLAAVSIVRIAEDTQSVPQDTFIGLVAPTRGTYTLALVDGLVPRPLNDSPGAMPPITVAPGVGGGPTTLPDMRLEGRVPRALQLRTLVPASAPVAAELTTTNGRLEGTVRNDGRERLEDAIVIAAGEAVGLGDLAPGESRPVSVSLPANRAAGAWQNGPPPWAVPGAKTGTGGDRRRALIAQLIQPTRGSDGETNGGAMLLAWTAGQTPRVTLGEGVVSGATRQLIEQALPIAYGDEQVAIPPGLIGRTVLDGTVVGRGNGSSFVARGPLIFQFDLPPGLELSRIDRLSLHLAIPGRPPGVPASLPAAAPAAPGSPPPRLSLYRWVDRTWVEVPLTGTGVSNMPSGASFVDGGSIRARIEPQGNEVQIDQLDLSLEGVRQ